MTPNSCRHCGREERGHFQRWTQAAGWHGWTAPTDAQRLERMRARRAHKDRTQTAAAPARATADQPNEA